MQNFIQEDDTGFFQIIYEVVETHEYSSDVTIFRTGFRSIAEKFIKEKTEHVLKNLKYRKENIKRTEFYKKKNEFQKNNIPYKSKQIL